MQPTLYASRQMGSPDGPYYIREVHRIQIQPFTLPDSAHSVHRHCAARFILKMIVLFSFIISAAAKERHIAIPGHRSANGSRCRAMLPESHSQKVYGRSHQAGIGRSNAAKPKLPSPRTECVTELSHLHVIHATLHLAHRASTDPLAQNPLQVHPGDRKSTRLNSSHLGISYAVFCLKKK